MKTIGIIGAGTMGLGIAQVFLQAGWTVKMYDIFSDVVETGRQKIEKSLARLVEKGKCEQFDMDAMLQRLIVEKGLDAFSDCALVLEATPEEMGLKNALFKELSGIMGEDCIMASNTSSLSITQIAASAAKPERVVGLHFFNPAPVMELVEVVRGMRTSEETMQEVLAIVCEIQKKPVVVADSPGFIVNRALVPMINEAAAMFAEGVADAESIDLAMKLGCNHPIGPLALADMIGLDIIQHVMETLQAEFGEDKYRVHPVIRKMVRAGTLGRKTKVGFYTYV